MLPDTLVVSTAKSLAESIRQAAYEVAYKELAKDNPEVDEIEKLVSTATGEILDELKVQL